MACSQGTTPGESEFQPGFLGNWLLAGSKDAARGRRRDPPVHKHPEVLPQMIHHMEGVLTMDLQLMLLMFHFLG